MSDEQSGGYTHVNLLEVEDLAARFGLSEITEARFANEALATEATGVCLQRLRPGRKQPFGHRHEQAEEVYVVLEGGGRVRLDDDTVELRRFDALRVAPHVARRFEAGPDGMTILVFGPRHPGDGERLPDFWA